MRTFSQKSNFVNGQQIVAPMFGGLDNLITLSLSLSLSLNYLTTNQSFVRVTGIRVFPYGFLCRNAREVGLFLSLSDYNGGGGDRHEETYIL